MRGVLLVAALCAAVIAASSQDATAAQRAGGEGVLEIVFSSELATGRNEIATTFTPSISPAGLLHNCTVWVFPDLSSVQLPVGTAVYDISTLTPVQKLRVPEDGRLTVTLPPDRYSVVQRDCFPIQIRSYDPCCPHIDADPGRKRLDTEDGEIVAFTQTVDVHPDRLARVTAIGRPEPEPSRRKILIVAGACLAALFGVAAIGSIRILRPVYNPVSDPDHPISLPPETEEEAQRKAGFDQVFGEFLRDRARPGEREGIDRHEPRDHEA
jgi:hypothetical protein